MQFQDELGFALTIPHDAFSLVDSAVSFTSSSEGPTTVSELVVSANVGAWSGGGMGGGGSGPEGMLDDHLSDESPPDVVPVDWDHMAAELKSALCGLAHKVDGMDGLLLYGKDGDGVDEFVNILNAASYLIGGVGLTVGLAKGILSSGAVLEAVGSLFGDDIALRVAYAPLAQLATAFGISAGVTNGASDLLNALTNGDIPDFCGSDGGNA